MFKKYGLKGRLSKEFIAILIVFLLLSIFIILRIKTSSKADSYNLALKRTRISLKNEREVPVEKNPSVMDSNIDTPIIKLYLLKKKNSQERKNTKRNIFSSFHINSEVIKPSAKKKTEEKKPLVLIEPINLKLVGIMELNRVSSSPKKELYGILCDDEGSYVVKKGDVLNNKYEILEIEKEVVKVKDIELNRVEVLILEKE